MPNDTVAMAHDGTSILNIATNGTVAGNSTNDNATSVVAVDPGLTNAYEICTGANVYVFPIQFILCIVGNILNILILTRERVTTSRQVYILSLSVTDLLYFCSQFFPFMDYNHIHVNYTEPNLNPGEFLIKYLGGLWNWWQPGFSLASDLILMAFCIERCVAITRPFSRLGSGRASTARRVVAIIVCFSLLHSWIQSYTFYRAIVLMNGGMSGAEAYAQKNMPNWLSIWWSEFQLVHLVALPVCVFVALVLTTTLILIALAKQRRYHRQTLDRFQQREANVSRQYTFMLMAAVVTYFLTCTLNFLLNVGDFIQTRFGYPNWFGREDVQRNLYSCQGMLSNWNYALNFILYSFVSSKFRQNMRLLTRHGLRRWSSDSGDTAEDLLSPDGSVHTRRRSRTSRNSSNDSRRSEWVQMNGHLRSRDSQPSRGSYIRDNIVNNGTAPLQPPDAINPVHGTTIQRTVSNGLASNGDDGVRFRFGSNNGHQTVYSTSNSNSSSVGGGATLLPSNTPTLTATVTSPPPLSPPPSPPTLVDHPTEQSPRTSSKSLSPFRRLKMKRDKSPASDTSVLGEYYEMTDTGFGDNTTVSRRVAAATDATRQRRASSDPKVSEQDHAELMKNELAIYKRSESK